MRLKRWFSLGAWPGQASLGGVVRSSWGRDQASLGAWSGQPSLGVWPGQPGGKVRPRWLRNAGPPR